MLSHLHVDERKTIERDFMHLERAVSDCARSNNCYPERDMQQAADLQVCTCVCERVHAHESVYMHTRVCCVYVCMRAHGSCVCVCLYARTWVMPRGHESWKMTTHCNTLQHTAAHCNTLQHTASRCDTLQHTHARSHVTRACVVSHAHVSRVLPCHESYAHS